MTRPLGYMDCCAVAHLLSRASADFYVAAGISLKGAENTTFQESAVNNLRQALTTLGISATIPDMRDEYLERIKAVAADDRITNGGMKSDVNGNLYVRD